MENDKEIKGAGNSIDFGARMYDPRIARWFAVDPLASKYPDLSPYNFVGNSPIVHIDSDGRDYEIYIDHNKKTIIIKLSYRTISNDADAKSLVTLGVNNINNQNGKFKYVVGKGENTKIYNISFEATEIQTTFGENNHFTSSEEPPSVLNSLQLVSQEVLDNLPNDGVEGANIGYNVYISENEKDTDRGKEIVKHELGHGMGMAHSETGKMTITGSGKDYTSTNIASILGRAGFGKYRDRKNSKKLKLLGTAVNKDKEIGTNNDFNTGKVVTSKKAAKIQKKLDKKK